MGKGEIARYEQFLLFPQCVQRTCTADTWKPGLLWVRVNSLWMTELTIFATFKPFPNKPWFLHVCSTSLLKTAWVKKKLLNKQFLFFPQCFLPVWKLFCHFHQIWNCRLQTFSVWKSLKFVFWERFKLLSAIKLGWVEIYFHFGKQLD